MGFSMSVHRSARIAHDMGSKSVRVWGSDADGSSDGLPVVVARGVVDVYRDGPAQCRITGNDGSVYVTTESSWAPIRGEWVCEARKIEEEQN